MGTLRIISGEFRSRIIQAPAGMDTRPTSDKAREAIFSILQNRIFGARFLDIFAGSGAMGLEAISRGAKYCAMIDCSREASRTIKSNIAALGVQDKIEVYCCDVKAAIARLNSCFDIVFLDPPYRLDCLADTLEQLIKFQVLSTDAVIIAEHEGEFLPPKKFELINKKKYGRAQFTFLKIKELENEDSSVPGKL